MKALFLSWILVSTFSACLAEDESRVSFSATIVDDVFGVVVKPGETGTMNWKTDQVVQKGDPPLGWTIEVKPTKAQRNKFLAEVVIRSATMNQGKGDFPVSTYAKCAFRFSLPVDGKVYLKNFPGFEKVAFKLDLVDAAGNPIPMRTSRAIRRR